VRNSIDNPSGLTSCPEIPPELLVSLETMGILDQNGGVAFVRNHRLVRLKRFGTLPDGTALLAVDEVTPLPSLDPRAGDQGA